jgi:hypothetical protein
MIDSLFLIDKTDINLNMYGNFIVFDGLVTFKIK